MQHDAGRVDDAAQRRLRAAREPVGRRPRSSVSHAASHRRAARRRRPHVPERSSARTASTTSGAAPTRAARAPLALEQRPDARQRAARVRHGRDGGGAVGGAPGVVVDGAPRVVPGFGAAPGRAAGVPFSDEGACEGRGVVKRRSLPSSRPLSARTVETRARKFVLGGERPPEHEGDRRERSGAAGGRGCRRSLSTWRGRRLCWARTSSDRVGATRRVRGSVAQRASRRSASSRGVRVAVMGTLARCPRRATRKFVAGNCCVGSSRRSKVSRSVTESSARDREQRAGSVSRGAVSSSIGVAERRRDADRIEGFAAVERCGSSSGRRSRAPDRSPG